MRAFSLGFSLLLVTPALAADRTETIPLRFVRAAEVQEMFLPEERAAGTGGLGAVKTAAPEGLVAWTANDATNSLTVTGSPQAIAAVKKIVRLVDVPARQIHLDVRVLRLDAAGRKQLDELIPPVKDPHPEMLRSTALVGKQIEQVTSGAKVLAAAELPTANQHPFHLRWTEAAGEPAKHLALTPRLNGDGSINLTWPFGTPGRPGEKSLFTIRRIPVGQTVIVVPHADGPALMVTFKSLGQ